MSLFPWFLYAHVLGAIIAFGPTFASPIIGGMGGSEPPHRNFALRLSKRIAEQRTVPLAILQGITGIGLILTAKVDLLATHWLLLAIVLYLTALAIAFMVLTPTANFLIERTSGGPPPAPPAGAPAGGPPPGPPPEVAAAIRRVRLAGMSLAGLVAVIAFLMVVKPSF